MNTREKLIVLIMESVGGCARYWAKVIADHLLKNGVVVIDTDAVSMKNRPLISTVASLPIDEVIDLVKAKIEGRLIVPPVKVGDTVWYIHGGYYRKTNLEARPITVTEISQKKVKDKLQWAFIANGTRYVFGSIGKAVFLSREDAEKVIAERSRQ